MKRTTLFPILLMLIPVISFYSCARQEGDNNAFEAVSSTAGEEGNGAPAEEPETGNVMDTEEYMHDRFQLTREDLLTLIDTLPSDIRGAINEDPSGFLDQLDKVLRQPQEQTVLVDKHHALASDYEPRDLLDLDTTDLRVNKKGMKLRQAIMPDLNSMNESASSLGLTLLISSAYRSYSYQEEVFQYHVDTIGEEQAKRESAEPGKSQHQLGTTIDFGSITPAFGDTPEGLWLKDHAWEYGFSLSYPEDGESLTGYMYEPWHFRWIGRAAARLERMYFGGSQHNMLNFLRENREKLNTVWNS